MSIPELIDLIMVLGAVSFPILAVYFFVGWLVFALDKKKKRAKEYGWLSVTCITAFLIFLVGPLVINDGLDSLRGIITFIPFFILGVTPFLAFGSLIAWLVFKVDGDKKKQKLFGVLFVVFVWVFLLSLFMPVLLREIV